MRTIYLTSLIGLATTLELTYERPLGPEPQIIGLPTPNGDVGDRCKSSRDCFSGLECLGGQCSANDFIILAGPGESCLGSNVQCAPSLMCNRGTCISFAVQEEFALEGESCLFGRQCAPGLMCNRGACFALPNDDEP